MKQEFSAGGAVHKRVGGVLLWLIGKHSGYHKWVLPKGMIEEGETLEETAQREVREETGVVAKIVGSEPLHVETYTYKADYSDRPVVSQNISRRVALYQESGAHGTIVQKTVTFFLMEFVSGDVSNHSWEMEEVVWLPYNNAMAKLVFAGEKIALQKANVILSADARQ